MPCPYTRRATTGGCPYKISKGRSPLRPYINSLRCLLPLRPLRLCGRDESRPYVSESRDDRPVAPTYFFLCGQFLPYFFSSLGKPYAAVIFSIYTFCLTM